MSIVKFAKGNIFDTKLAAMVCPVNCGGVMGAGLAKVFRDKFDNQSYKDACMKGEMAPGSILVRQPEHAYKDTDKTLIYFATKSDWRDDSKIEWIELGLLNLVKAMKYYNIDSIALPAVGCGCGHLSWPTIELIIKDIFQSDGQAKIIEVYEPI